MGSQACSVRVAAGLGAGSCLSPVLAPAACTARHAARLGIPASSIERSALSLHNLPALPPLPTDPLYHHRRGRPVPQIKLTFAAGALRMGRAYRFDAYAQNAIGWGPRSDEPLVDQVPYYPA